MELDGRLASSLPRVRGGGIGTETEEGILRSPEVPMVPTLVVLNSEAEVVAIGLGAACGQKSPDDACW